jgi:hypothetical protein
MIKIRSLVNYRLRIFLSRRDSLTTEQMFYIM